MNTASIFAGAIASVTANSWTGGGLIFGTTLGQLKIKGAFVGGVDGKSLSSFTAGSIGAGTWGITVLSDRLPPKASIPGKPSSGR